MAPASSSDRAEARSQRALRKIAAAEIDPSARSRRPPPEPAPTLPPPKPETLPEEVVDAGPPDAEPDATPADAARDAVADSEATAAADPCEPLCERISRCALDRFPPGMDPSILDRLRESIERGRERCVEECRAEIRLNGDSKAEDAQACLAIEDCEALMECVSNLMSGGM